MPPTPRRTERGAAVVDLVLVMVVLIPLVLGIFQVGITLYIRNTLSSAVTEGARVGAALGHTPAEGARHARREIASIVANRYARGVSYRVVDVEGAPSVEIRVTATVPALGIGGPAMTFTVTGHAVQERS